MTSIVVRSAYPIGATQIEELLQRVLGREADEQLRKTLLRLLMQTAVEGANEPAARLGQRPTLSLNHPVLQRLATDHLPKIVGINETTRVAIRDGLLGVIASGGTLQQQVDLVRGVFRDASAVRALTIARTENGIFWNAGGHRQMVELGARSHTWLSSHDPRVRPTHVDADGQCRPLEAAFDVGYSKLQHPLDPAGPPEETINCRCVEIPGVSPCGAERVLSPEQRESEWRRVIRSVDARERLTLVTTRRIFRGQRTAILTEIRRLTGT